VETPFISRLAEACDLVGAKLEVIPGADNSGRITLPSGRVRYFRRLHWDLNTLGAAAIAVDKDATSRVLKGFGYTVPTGRSFARNWRVNEARDIADAYAYARRLGLPVLLKPNDSSSDQQVSVTYTRAQFYAAAREVFAASKKLLVQRIARGTDCSIVVLDDEVLMASEKSRPYVVGDGHSSIRTLMGAGKRRTRPAWYTTDLPVDDVRVARHLAHEHRTLATVPRPRERVELLPCGNLGIGGDIRVVTDVLHPKLAALAVRLVRDLGLRIASVDLVLSRPSDAPPQRCTVLEVNSAPGLDTHEREPGWTRRRVERVSRVVLALDVGSPWEVERMATKTTAKKRAAKPAPPKTVEEYLAAAPRDKRAALAKLRKTIKAAAPKAIESLSYGIVGYKQDGQRVAYFGYWKDHIALYGTSGRFIKAHAAELKPYVRSKGTIQFPSDQPLPVGLVTKIVKARVAEVATSGS
jgi:uncharacterized protein YdhG (YjbR/CyaY superfamily)/D-alanine-D-alanine ligase-like ATP-grasp enzyme